MIQKKDIKFLIVHCSDTPDEDNLRAIDIHKMHLSFGWEGIGYHKIICRNGDIENGRPEYWMGAHTYGKNRISLGVCLIGKNKFLDSQLLSLKNLLIEWKKQYPSSIILGHRDAIKTKKTCPNFDVKKWCKKEEIFL
jgi:N-acetylmuramoyl-L-alanine amidase